MNASPINQKPLLTVRPGDYIRLRGWPFTAYFKVVVNASGIKLKRARIMESWGAVLGANMAHQLENGTNVNVFGLEFVVSGDTTGKTCTVIRIEEL